METIIIGIGTFLSVLGKVLFAGGAIVAAAATLSYAVRTRRINPFSSVARITRDSIDPLFAPVERRVVRAGGRPATAPWWALAAFAIAAIVLLNLLQFIATQVLAAMQATQGGGMHLVRLLVSWTFGVLQIALLVRVLSSWIQVSPYSRWIRWSFGLTEWLLRPLRQIIPPFGMMDVTPIAAYFVLRILAWLVSGLIPG